MRGEGDKKKRGNFKGEGKAEEGRKRKKRRARVG